MSSLNSIQPTRQLAQQAVIISFSEFARKKNQFQPCIFCGETMTVQMFKGKNVCTRCLHQIPAIFSFG
ncbi:hypothetical protein Desaci_3793 [Desulfosporosinus acidiphilus SJ4]|uniref:Uncharacterized protein n=1 Tax=Desulfosporosinus acidiphilus (strain DSM 22704 / JCM 16185 / SJ4) TaxID=646529 RepID=I4DA50_DESAJ|nr:hypothetical protein [Desulfosporosinus acidiphilus]AFM42674.1 hypothetical protein Desaci_3793 [Desulfosporosinus acidiphilus SJ4]